MKSVIAAGLLAALALAPIASAEAAVTYSFAGASVPGAAASVPLNIQLVLTSAETGFTLSGGPSNGSGVSFQGSVDRFVSLTIGSDSISPNFLAGAINLALAFDSAGIVTSTSLSYRGNSYDARLYGTGPSASGYVGLAQSPCMVDAANCGVSGNWTSTGSPTAVPEPMSLALFGAGLAGLAMVRRRKA